MDPFLVEVLGEERRRYHRPHTGRRLSCVREQGPPDKRSSVAGAGHDEIPDLARARAGRRHACAVSMRWRNDLDCRKFSHDGAPLQLPTH